MPELTVESSAALLARKVTSETVHPIVDHAQARKDLITLLLRIKHAPRDRQEEDARKSLPVAIGLAVGLGYIAMHEVDDLLPTL